MSNFTPLHLHTQYSILDSAIKIKDLIKYLKEIDISSCAITDHGVMSGVIDFYSNCKDNNIKPLLGVEAYCTFDDDNYDLKSKIPKTKDNFHIVLIAKNNDGYRELLELISEAALFNFYYKPRISINKLHRLHNKVICSTACLAGILTKIATWNENSYTDPDNNILRMYNLLCDSIGKDNIYLELQDWNDDTGHQQAWNKFLLDFGMKNNSQYIITTDAHFLKEQDFEMHELMMAMQLKMTLQQYRSQQSMRYGPFFWVKPPDLMLQSAKNIGCEEAFWNTGKITDKCEDIKIEFGIDRNPIFDPKQANDYQEFIKLEKENNV